VPSTPPSTTSLMFDAELTLMVLGPAFMPGSRREPDYSLPRVVAREARPLLLRESQRRLGGGLGWGLAVEYALQLAQLGPMAVSITLRSRESYPLDRMKNVDTATPGVNAGSKLLDPAFMPGRWFSERPDIHTRGPPVVTKRQELWRPRESMRPPEKSTTRKSHSPMQWRRQFQEPKKC
jgi:hypothetical protein